MFTTEKENIVLAMHKNPDGDSCGAAWAIKLALEKKYPNKKVFIYSDSKTTKFGYAPNFPEVKFTSYDELPEDNQLYILDHFDQEYSLVPNWKAEKFTAWKVIDHHWIRKTDNKKWQLWIDISKGSTCEIIFDYMREHENDLITPEVAASLVLGIKSDSLFVTSDTRPKIFYMLNDLMKVYGSEEIVKTRHITGYNGYFTYDKFMAIVFIKMSQIHKRKTVTLKLDMKTYERLTKRNKIYLGKIFSKFSGYNGVEHAIIVYEVFPDIWNIAFRTKKPEVVHSLKKRLNRQFLDYGFTIAGIAGEKECENQFSIIKEAIKNYINDRPAELDL